MRISELDMHLATYMQCCHNYLFSMLFMQPKQCITKSLLDHVADNMLPDYVYYIGQGAFLWLSDNCTELVVIIGTLLIGQCTNDYDRH